MTVNYAVIKDDMLEFGFSEGKICVDIRMTYDAFADFANGLNGNLHDLVAEYVKHCFNIANLLS